MKEQFHVVTSIGGETDANCAPCPPPPSPLQWAKTVLAIRFKLRCRCWKICFARSCACPMVCCFRLRVKCVDRGPQSKQNRCCLYSASAKVSTALKMCPDEAPWVVCSREPKPRVSLIYGNVGQLLTKVINGVSPPLCRPKAQYGAFCAGPRCRYLAWSCLSAVKARTFTRALPKQGTPLPTRRQRGPVCGGCMQNGSSSRRQSSCSKWPNLSSC